MVVIRHPVHLRLKINDLLPIGPIDNGGIDLHQDQLLIHAIDLLVPILHLFLQLFLFFLQLLHQLLELRDLNLLLK